MEQLKMHTGFQWEDLKGKDLSRRPRDEWEDNIKMDLKELGCVAILVPLKDVP